ncbi:MAG TPA: 50S ribosomal protein L5 [Elusimicrobiota bacterium]|nr:50S ribosomal protein L5 [Elusimicrobiota bacterium]
MKAKTDNEPRLKKHYRAAVVPGMIQKFGFKNPFQVPVLNKIILNMGVNDAKEDIKSMDQASAELSAIAGQKPQVRRAKKSISNFKLRAGMPIGLRVTLRGARMYEFLDRFVNAAIPRIRDFRGLDPRAFDGRGNYNLGLNEQHIFPEVDMEKSTKLRGLNVTLVTNARDDAKARELLTLFGFPFKASDKEETTKKPKAQPASA